MRDTIKSVSFCIVAAIAAAVPSYLLILYWGGFTYRGFVNIDVLALSLILAGTLAIKNRIFKITAAILCLAAIAGSLIFDIQNLCVQSPLFQNWICSFPSAERITFEVIFILLILSVCMCFSSHAKPVKWDMAITAILAVFLVHCFVYGAKTSCPIAISPALQKLEFYADAKIKDDRSTLSPALQKLYPHPDSPIISPVTLMAKRTNIIILIKSWGVPRDSIQWEHNFDVFSQATVTTSGILKLDSASTTYAEREAFNRARIILSTDSLQSAYLYAGADSLYDRKHYIPKFGFDDVFFGNGVSDSVMCARLDSLLNSVQSASSTIPRHLFCWMTSATQFPMEDSAYYTALRITQKRIASLAQKHKEMRFIVLGDHEPLLCQRNFRGQFYKHFVPYIVLN